MASSSAAVDEPRYTFFWRSDSPFSQWHPCEFTVDGVAYNCTEQFMMHQKAVLFGDKEMAAKILKSKSPKEQKSFGRKVKDFDPDVWNTECRNIVKKGNMAKFSQNETLWCQLLATDGSTLVEASPRDCIWGIGLGASNPKALNKATWRGRNWLGYALTAVRDQLKEEKGIITAPKVIDDGQADQGDESPAKSERKLQKTQKRKATKTKVGQVKKDKP